MSKKLHKKDAQNNLTIGDKAEDGWIYVGKSRVTHKPIFVAPADAGEMSWEKAGRAAAAHHARLPSPHVLKMMFNNKAVIGGFEKDQSYWTSSVPQHHWALFATTRHSDNGQPGIRMKDCKLPVRFVRS